jgi:hypothetical protein
MAGREVAARRRHRSIFIPVHLMPIVRYFVFAGAFVVALLFALDRSLPPLAEISAGRGVDRSTIRIHSARARPDKIIFDTSTQLANVISSPVLASERRDDHASQAFAMAAQAKPAQQKLEAKIARASQRSSVRATRLRSKRTVHSRRLADRQEMAGAF